MKCPECEKNHKYSAGMRCSCGYQFRLDPKIDGFSDNKMLALIRRASAHDTYYFTKNQLYAQYCRMEYRSLWIPLILSAVLISLGLYLCFLADIRDRWVFGGTAVVAGLFALMFAEDRHRSKPSTPTLDNALEKWRRNRADTLERMLTEPTLHQPPPEWKEPDIYDYGVERILIVEHDLLVDLFVKNGFHAEQRTLVLSQNGYPSYLVGHAKRMLDENPELPVFLLHDATEQGEQMQEQLLARGDLPIAGRHVIDMGLFPQDVAKLRRLRFMRPKEHEYRLPVDILAYSFLATGLGSALADELTLAQVADQLQQSGGTNDSSSFG